MTGKPSILAIIPARGGSKGIARKNMHYILGWPLLLYTIHAATTSNVMTRVVVSSEDTEILEYAKKYCSVVRRPVELSGDDTPCEPVIDHCIRQYKEKGEEFEYIMVLQPTSPLRNCYDIAKAVKEIHDQQADSLISVYAPKQNPLKSFLMQDGYLKGIVNNEYPFTNRQSLPEVYQSNGAIYMTRTDLFLKHQTLFSEKTIPFVMPEEKSIDIDTLADMKVAEEFLTHTIRS